MFNNMPMSIGLFRGGASPSFSPSSFFTNAEAGGWYDASDLNTLFQDSAGTIPVTADGDPVARWEDKSGNGNHLLQVGVDATRPLYKTSDGLHWLEADGTKYLRATFDITYPFDRISGIWVTFWVSGDRMFSGVNLGGILFQTGVSPALVLYDGLAGPSINTLALNTAGVITERHDDANSKLALNNDAYATGISGTTAAGGLVLFASNGGANLIAGRCYGLVMREGILSDEQITSARSFFANLSGVTL